MNTLEKILGFPIRVKKTRSKHRTPLSPEKKMLENTKYIMNVIKRGDYNPKYYQHRVKAQRAIKEGYLDKDLNILKEV